MNLSDSKQNFETLALEVIEFLQKWGMWSDVQIFTNGNMYRAVDKKEKVYKGLPYVEFYENINPDNYTTGYVSCDYDEESYNAHCFTNPEHIFDMTYEGSLYLLFNDDEFSVEYQLLSREAWNSIFECTDILEDYLISEYNISDAYDLLELIMNNDIIYFKKSDYILWDRLEFDTWEEYQNFCSDEEEILTDTFAEYSENTGFYSVLSTDNIMPLWDKIVDDAKKDISDDNSLYENLLECYNYEINNCIKSEFMEIFDRYGLWYEYGYKWSLTCYRR